MKMKITFKQLKGLVNESGNRYGKATPSKSLSPKQMKKAILDYFEIMAQDEPETGFDHAADIIKILTPEQLETLYYKVWGLHEVYADDGEV